MCKFRYHIIGKEKWYEIIAKYRQNRCDNPKPLSVEQQS